jgi:hypothetical protein
MRVPWPTRVLEGGPAPVVRRGPDRVWAGGAARLVAGDGRPLDRVAGRTYPLDDPLAGRHHPGGGHQLGPIDDDVQDPQPQERWAGGLRPQGAFERPGDVPVRLGLRPGRLDGAQEPAPVRSPPAGQRPRGPQVVGAHGRRQAGGVDAELGGVEGIDQPGVDLHRGGPRAARPSTMTCPCALTFVGATGCPDESTTRGWVHPAGRSISNPWSGRLNMTVGRASLEPLVASPRSWSSRGTTIASPIATTRTRLVAAVTPTVRRQRLRPPRPCRGGRRADRGHRP